MLFALCLLISSSQLTSLSPSLFPGIRLIVDFIATSFTHAFFLTERPFFQLTHDNLPAKFSHDNLLVTSDLRKLVTPFPIKLELKNKNKENNGTIIFS